MTWGRSCDIGDGAKNGSLHSLWLSSSSATPDPRLPNTVTLPLSPPVELVPEVEDESAAETGRRDDPRSAGARPVVAGSLLSFVAEDVDDVEMVYLELETEPGPKLNPAEPPAEEMSVREDGPVGRGAEGCSGSRESGAADNRGIRDVDMMIRAVGSTLGQRQIRVDQLDRSRDCRGVVTRPSTLAGDFPGSPPRGMLCGAWREEPWRLQLRPTVDGMKLSWA